MKALVGAFNQEKALVGAFSVIVMNRLQLYLLTKAPRLLGLAGVRHAAGEMAHGEHEGLRH